MTAIRLDLKPLTQGLTHEQFYELYLANKDVASESVKLQPLQAKMQEYLASDLRLGWLINPYARKVEIYRAGTPVEVKEFSVKVSGEDVLPGFVLEIS